MKKSKIKKLKTKRKLPPIKVDKDTTEKEMRHAEFKRKYYY